MAPAVPVGVAAAGVAVALALLVVSFGSSIVILETRNPVGR
jgi:hypothetical protein